MHRMLLLLFAGAACSQPAAAQSGFYVGGTVGNTSVDTEFDDTNLNFDENDFAWSALAGVQAPGTLAVEASYNDFGRFDASRRFDLTQTDIDAELTGFDVMGVLSLPAGPLSLFGKAGLVFWDRQATALIRPPIGSVIRLDEDDNGADLAVGGGLDFRLTPTLSLRGEVEWFDVEETEQVWFASAGMTMRF